MKTMVSTAGSGLPAALQSSDVLAPGAKAGPWVVERELGRGGMGAVYAVVHEEIGKRAALKVVHQRLLSSGFNCDRMLLEAKVVNQVGHPNIVDIFETGKLADGRPYIVMERLDGQALSLRADAGKLLPDLVIAILSQVCDALIAAHAGGVVHRDLKLDNVFLVDNPDDPATPKVKLLDWGIAKVMSHDVRHTVEGQLVGTPQYLSPEQARGQEVTPQTDVYSLGVMAYELFLEQLPFEAETAAEVMAMHLRVPPPPPHELWPDIPPQLEGLLLAMLAKRAEQRPTMLEVARQLDIVRRELDRRRRGPGPGARDDVQRRIATTGIGSTVRPIADVLAERLESRPRIRATPNRVIVSQGLAATQPAWRMGSRRWQYAIGASALAASAILFCISRVGDRTADAATTVREASREAAPSPAFAGTRTIALPTNPAPNAPALISTEARPARLPSAPSAPKPTPRSEPRSAAAIARASAVRPSSPSQTSRAATAPPQTQRSSPVTPRRGLKVDPDGTFAVYE